MRLTHTLAALLLATGCVGTVDDLDPVDTPTPDAGVVPTGKEGQKVYVRDVHPIVMAQCSGGACHAIAGVTGIYGFAVPDGNSSYQQVISVPTLVGTYTPQSATFMTEIDPGPHNTAVYSAEDKAKIAGWLAQEVTDRNNDPTAPPVIDPIAKLKEWSGCMSLENFQAANMAQAWNQLASVNNQKCAGCHSQGLDGFMSGNGQAEPFFNAITSQKDLLLKYFTVDAMGAVIINTAAFQNAGVNLPNSGNNHPRFNPTTNIGMTALAEFYDLTVARQTAMTCDPPRLP